MKTLRCTKCNTTAMEIVIRDSCDDCQFNGVFDEEEESYQYPVTTDKERTEVNNEGSCDYGDAYGNGCHMYICVNCHEFVNNIAMFSE